MQTLRINQKKFRLLNQRAYVPVLVYKGHQEYLRLGPTKILEPEIKLHRKLLEVGFPVPKLIAEGKYKKQHYFIEESFGEKHFGFIFADDCRKRKTISNVHFKQFLKTVTSFAKAQIKTRTSRRDIKNFYHGANINRFNIERPDLKIKTDKALAKILQKVSVLPFVLSHGDFGPFNIYVKGVIDLESFFEAPLGYDLVTALYMTDFFPEQSEEIHRNGFEMKKLFSFSKAQNKNYFSVLDKLFKKNNLPKLSDFRDEFILVRCLWTAARMQDWPKIQKWRFEQYEKLLNAYLAGKNLSKYL